MRAVLTATDVAAGGVDIPAGASVASVGRRARAAALDLLLIVVGEVVTLIVGGLAVSAAGATPSTLSTSHVGVAAAIARALLQSALFLGPGVYLYVSWSRGASVGMRALQCRLCSSDGVATPTSGEVLLRMCGLWFSLACGGVGLVWGLTRADRRGWSDLMGRTVVTHTPSPSPPPGAWGAWPPAAGVALPPTVWGPFPPPPPAPPSVDSGRREAGERTPWTWSDVVPVVLLILPLSLGVQYLTVQALKWLLAGVAVNTRRPIEAVISDVTAYGAVLLLVLLFVKLRRHASPALLGLRRVEWRWLVAVLPFAFGAFLLEGITGQLSQSLFPHTPANQCTSLRSAYQGALWLALLGVAVVAPLVEEIVFRGMVFGWLRGRLPVAWAVLISAALFSLEHIGFLQLTLFLPIFATGVVLAVLYHHARSIWPSVVVHGTFNLIATLVLFTSASC